MKSYYKCKMRPTYVYEVFHTNPDACHFVSDFTQALQTSKDEFFTGEEYAFAKKAAPLVEEKRVDKQASEKIGFKCKSPEYFQRIVNRFYEQRQRDLIESVLTQRQQRFDQTLQSERQKLTREIKQIIAENRDLETYRLDGVDPLFEEEGQLNLPRQRLY